MWLGIVAFLVGLLCWPFGLHLSPDLRLYLCLFGGVFAMVGRFGSMWL